MTFPPPDPARIKHQLPSRPSFVPMHGKKPPVAAPVRATRTQLASSDQPEAGQHHALTWQQKGLLQPLKSRYHLQSKGASPKNEACLTWQQREMLQRQADQPASLEPIVVSIDTIDQLRPTSPLPSLAHVPPPLRFDMTEEGPQVSLHSKGDRRRLDCRAGCLPNSPQKLVKSTMPDGPPPCDNVSDLPTWYDPFKDGPLCVVSGAEAKSTERSTASTASTASTLSPPLSLHAFGGAEAWCARRDAPDSPALSSTPSTPALDSSSSQSSIYSPSISSSATSSPDSLHAFVRTPFPAYHLDAASAAAEYRNATAEIATNESGPDAYAGPLFCSNAPLPQTLPVPAFSKRPRWTSPLPAGDRL